MTMLALFFFVILVAIGGLAIDIGRVYSLRGQMVAYVDQVALASAAELDGHSDAIDRAYRVALGDTVDGAQVGPLVSTSYNFAQTNNLSLYNLIFLSQIASGPGPTPESGDLTYIVCSYQNGAWQQIGGKDCDQDAAANEKAQFVAVTSTSLSISYFVLPIATFFLGSNAVAETAKLQMQATARYKLIACNLTPMMMCNPDESTTNTDANFFDLDQHKGAQLNLQTTTAGINGYYGWISPDPNMPGPCASDPHPLDCMLARVSPDSQCIDAGAIDPQPGAVAHTFDSLNVRFDMYSGTQNNNNKGANAALYAPAPDVTKGICSIKGGGKGGGTCATTGNSVCTPSNLTNAADLGSTPPVTVPLPRDQSFSSGGLGTGLASTALATYWATNHPGVSYPTGTSPADGSSYTTRYSIYRYEVGNSIPNKSKLGGENGNAMCNATAPTDTSETPPARDRRILYVAVVDCHAAGMTKANPCTGAGYNPCMPVAGYLKLFMTEPIGYNATQSSFSNATQNANVYAEIVDAVKANEDNDIVHVVPVLYR